MTINTSTISSFSSKFDVFRGSFSEQFESFKVTSARILHTLVPSECLVRRTPDNFSSSQPVLPRLSTLVSWCNLALHLVVSESHHELSVGIRRSLVSLDRVLSVTSEFENCEIVFRHGFVVCLDRVFDGSDGRGREIEGDRSDFGKGGSGASRRTEVDLAHVE